MPVRNDMPQVGSWSQTNSWARLVCCTKVTPTESVNGSSTVSYGYDNDGLLTSSGALTITPSPSTGFVSGTTLGQVKWMSS